MRMNAQARMKDILLGIEECDAVIRGEREEGVFFTRITARTHRANLVKAAIKIIKRIWLKNAQHCGVTYETREVMNWLWHDVLTFDKLRDLGIIEVWGYPNNQTVRPF